MKITILVPQKEFTLKQQARLFKLGRVVYSHSRRKYPLERLLKITQGSEILGVDPDNLGGFEKAMPILTRVMESLPNLKGVCLSTTSFGWIDLNYCRKRGIQVSNVPGYSGESVAEHTLALLLCLAKKIIVTDRKTQKGAYKLEMGFELKGKTLGIIGLGDIGSKVSKLAQGIDMRVIAYNRSTKKQKGVKMKSFDQVLRESDAISLHTTHEEKNKGIIGEDQIMKMKDGVIIVNTVDRDLVNEGAMVKAIRSDKVCGYAYEAEDLKNTPLANVEKAVGIKGFGWYTKEALENLYRIWTHNIVALAKGKPQNLVK